MGKQAVRVMQVADDMKAVQNFLKSKRGIAEVYSPPRVVNEAKAAGLKAGFSLDLTTYNAAGQPWDFSKRSCRKEAWRLLQEQRPYMLVGSPPCTAYSILQNLNMLTKEGWEKVKETRRRAEVHLRFCAAMYHEQMNNGRYFVHEHPKTACSWEAP